MQGNVGKREEDARKKAEERKIFKVPKSCWEAVSINISNEK